MSPDDRAAARHSPRFPIETIFHVTRPNGEIVILRSGGSDRLELSGADDWALLTQAWHPGMTDFPSGAVPCACVYAALTPNPEEHLANHGKLKTRRRQGMARADLVLTRVLAGGGYAVLQPVQSGIGWLREWPPGARARRESVGSNLAYILGSYTDLSGTSPTPSSAIFARPPGKAWRGA